MTRRLLPALLASLTALAPVGEVDAAPVGASVAPDGSL